MDERARARGAGASVRSSRTPLALVLEPARDLAEQTHAHFETFSAYLTHPRVTSGLFVGGVDAKSQTETLRGGCDVAVGTPGRVLDLVESGALNLSGVRFFVLDEADRLLDAGNQGDILRLFARMPRSGPGFKSLQVLLFSATLHSPEISKLATTLCREPTWVDLKGKEHVPDTVHHAVYVVDPGSENPAALVPAAPVDNMHDESGGGGGGADRTARERVVFGDETTETPRRSARRGRAQDGPVFDFLSHQFRLR